MIERDDHDEDHEDEADEDVLDSPLTLGDVLHALEAARAVPHSGPEGMLSAAIRSLLEGVGMEEEEPEAAT